MFKNLRKPRILDHLVGFLIGISVFACVASEDFKVFAFDLSTSTIYYGEIEKPEISIPLNDPRLEEFVCMTVDDLKRLKDRCAISQ